jgi:hypothetical protein
MFGVVVVFAFLWYLIRGRHEYDGYESCDACKTPPDADEREQASALHSQRC